MSGSSVVTYFEGRSIFVTGATGFIGKVLLEKLLRSCVKIQFIYVLIRPSSNASPQERLEKLLKSPIFTVLRTDSEEIFKKVIPISGDLTATCLGISKRDQNILSANVSVIFHVAATVKLNEPLNVALKINLEGTYQILKLSRTMKNISSIVCVSSAYSNSDIQDQPILETVYPCILKPKFWKDMCALLSHHNKLRAMTPIFLGKKMNTYTLSKHLAECLIERKASKWNLPVCIVRPSITSNIHNEPALLEGWTDTTPTTYLFHNAGMGLSYISPGDASIKLDVIPVDYVVKIIILAAWETGALNAPGNDRSTHTRVFNACINNFNPISQGTFNNYVAQSLTKYPFSKGILLPSVRITICPLWHCANFFAVGIPCIVLDIFAFLRGQKIRNWKMYKNVQAFNNVTSEGKKIHLEFSSKNVKDLRSKIIPAETEIFKLDMENLNWKRYIDRCIHGTRRYYIQEPDSSIPVSVQNLMRIRATYSVIGAVLLMLLVTVAVSLFSFLENI